MTYRQTGSLKSSKTEAPPPKLAEPGPNSFVGDISSPPDKVHRCSGLAIVSGSAANSLKRFPFYFTESNTLGYELQRDVGSDIL